MGLGADEAGKGPVLGSMFAAAVRADPAALPDGVGDSKTIAPERREALDGAIRGCADAVAVVEVPVDRIDDPGTDMNALTVEAHARALGRVVEDGPSANGDQVATVDAADVDAARFGRRVAEAIEGELEIRAVHRADETDPLVGAASVVAKVARDAHVAELAARHGEVGSGYPSDPRTREFLRTHVESTGELPSCARKSWQTSADVLAAAAQSRLADF